MCFWTRQTQRKRGVARKREDGKKRGNHIFWQLGLALAVIRRGSGRRERGIRQNKASSRKTKAPLQGKKHEEEITAT